MRDLLLVAALALSCGCTVGAHGTVTANSARYPISLSSMVRDRDGEIVRGAELERVGRIRYEAKSWAMLWGLVELTDAHDISTVVNSEVQAAGGDAVINLTVATDSCGWNMLVYFNPLHILPVWPGCVNLEVEGDIVRVKGRAPDQPVPILYAP